MAKRCIYGVGPVRELVKARAGRIEVVYVEPGRASKRGDAVGELVQEARAAGIAVEERSRQELDRMAEADARHQGVIAITGAFAYAELDDIVAAAAARGEPALVVALDGVQDPHNLGAVIRSAYVMGAHGVVIPEHRAAAVTPVVTKASAGATELLPLAVVTNLARAIGELKEAGLWAAAVASAPDATPIDQLDATGPMVLVLGAEGTGVRLLVSKSCDFHVEIPMASPGVGSLNVSVAAGMALYEVTRQRRAKRA
jgi:23S rRNA (guanosine2251-2'-O)-methyltransferase